jgi:DNA-binding transcriptional LysR family regulator
MTLLAKGGLSLERMQALLEFAEAGSLIKAAQSDPVRQSLLSRQIRELGQFFGAELVARRGRGIVLTEAGRQLAALARGQFKSLEDFTVSCGASSVRLSLASARSILNHIVLPRLRTGLVRGATIDLYHERSVDSAAAVAEGRYDFCIVDRSPLPRQLAARPLGKLTYSLYVPKTLASKVTTLEAALRELPLALPAAGRIRELLDAKIGDNLGSVVGLPGFDACFALLRTGRYAATLPDVALTSSEAKSFLRLPLDAAGIKGRTFSLVWNKRAAQTRHSVAKAAEVFADTFRFDR